MTTPRPLPPPTVDAPPVADGSSSDNLLDAFL